MYQRHMLPMPLVHIPFSAASISDVDFLANRNHFTDATGSVIKFVKAGDKLRKLLGLAS